MKKILWIDNDPGYIKPFVLALRDEGISVEVASTVSQAERTLDAQLFDLVILDVMIPTVNSAEEELYSPDETEGSLKTGLMFYKRKKAFLAERGMPVFVMTVRIDKAIRKEFMIAGLAEGDFATKMELRDVQVFLPRIKALIRSGISKGGSAENG